MNAVSHQTSQSSQHLRHCAGGDGTRVDGDAVLRRFDIGTRCRAHARQLRIRSLLKTQVLLRPMARRSLDMLISGCLLLIAAPVLLPLIALDMACGRKLVKKRKVGRYFRQFDLLRLPTSDSLIGRFVRRFNLDRVPVLWNVFKGDMAIVGPRPLAPGEVDPKGYNVRRRLEDRPGLICLWWIRLRANIAYGTEDESDTEYIEQSSLRNDLGILLRAIPAILYGKPPEVAPDRLSILDIPIDNVDMDGSIEWIVEQLHGDTSKQICFVNADCANIAWRDNTYRELLRKTDFVLADGIGMKLAGKILGTGIRENVNGTDLFPRLCERLAGTGKRLYLLGGRPGVPDGVHDWIKKHHPDMTVCGVRHGYFNDDELPEVLAAIRESRADLLLVAFGAPRQDLWLAEHLADTGVKVAVGVGGLFDFFSGRIPRAPQWVRELCLEWVYRFLQEPGRLWKRYFLGNGIFLSRVFWDRVKDVAREKWRRLRNK